MDNPSPVRRKVLERTGDLPYDKVIKTFIRIHMFFSRLHISKSANSQRIVLLLIAIMSAAALTFAFAPQVRAESCQPGTPGCQNVPNPSNCDEGDCTGLITKYMNPLIKLLSGLVGLSVAGSIIYGGIMYASAADDTNRITQAKKRIEMAIIALVAYMVLIAFLEWLIPGGLL